MTTLQCEDKLYVQAPRDLELNGYCNFQHVVTALLEYDDLLIFFFAMELIIFLTIFKHCPILHYANRQNFSCSGNARKLCPLCIILSAFGYHFYLFIINTVQTSIREYISTDTDKKKCTFNTSMQHFSL